MKNITGPQHIRTRQPRASRRSLVIAALLCLAGMQCTASATTYYLDSNAAPGGNGSMASPWKTWDEANSALGVLANNAAGDILVVSSGNYGSTANSSVLCKPRADWFTIRAAEGQRPVFTSIRITPSAKTDVHVCLDGLTIEPVDGGNTPIWLERVSHVRVVNCTVVGASLAYEGVYAPYIRPLTTCIYGRDADDITIAYCRMGNAARPINIDFSATSWAHRWTISNNVIHRMCEDAIKYSKIDTLVIEDNYCYDWQKRRGGWYLEGTLDAPFTPGEMCTETTSGAKLIYHGTLSNDYAFYQTTTTDPSRTGTVVADDGTGRLVYSDRDDLHTDIFDTHSAYLKNIIIRRNHLNGLGSSQGITIYGYGGAEDITIENNLVYGAEKACSLHGAVGVKFNNNTMLDGQVRLQLLDQSSVGNCTLVVDEMYNNIIYRLIHESEALGKDGQMKYIRVLSHGNNVFGNNPDGAGGPTYPFRRDNQTELVNTMPLFLDAQNKDFRLAAGSAAINFGNPAHQPADSLGNLGSDRYILNDGVTRDASRHSAGCYEYDGAVASSGPILAAIGNRTVTVGTTLSFEVSASNPDGGTLTYSAAGLPSGAQFSAQRFTWTPAAGQVGDHQMTFTVSDGTDQNSQTITITVEAAPVPNSPPVLDAIGDKSVREDETLNFPVRATDPDDSEDALAYSATGLPSGAQFTERAFLWTPGYNQAGSYQVTFIVSDGRAQDSQTITISVANVNRPPALNGMSDRSVDAGNALTFSVSALDPDGDSLTYAASGTPTGASFAGQDFSWTPTADQAGPHNITFEASDGESHDSRTITVTVVAPLPDTTAPVVARCSPEPGSIQVPVNNLMTLHITDAGSGVDPASVAIQVNGQTVYQGDQAVHTSAAGRCSRSGTRHEYRFTYQADQMADFDETVTVRVSAADLDGNVMSEHSYSYVTEMRSFGVNRQVRTDGGSSDRSHPATVSDAAGNLWAVWHEGPQGARDIYAAKRPAGADMFATPVRLTSDFLDQCNPDIAAGADGRVYVTWQDKRRGNWDIFMSIGSDGQDFSRGVPVTDSDHNEIHPAIIVDQQSPDRVCIAWQDDRNGNQDIYVAVSANAFASSTVSQVTTDIANQTDPDLTIIQQSVICAVWTDMRNGHADIYGAASDAGPWTNVPIVTGAGDQTDPAVAAKAGGSVLHLLWVDNAAGNQDICYVSSAGMPNGPVAGSSIVDDTSGADQAAPAIVCAENGKAFACWQDARHAGSGGDTDLYFAEPTSGTTGTNILVGDGNTGAGQSEPAIGVDGYGHPYVVWTDDRGQNTEVYWAAATFIDPQPLDSRMISASAGGIVGTDPSAIRATDDVSVVVPPGACPADVRVTISKVLNPQVQAVEFLGGYDFGPSGVDFDQPVTVTVPYRHSSAGGGQATPYWYDSLTGALSQRGITDVENIVLTSDLNALRFKTTHFTPFYIVAGGFNGTMLGGDSGGGIGCSISATGNGSPRELVVPYAVVALVMIILRRRDTRRRRSLPLAEP